MDDRRLLSSQTKNTATPPTNNQSTAATTPHHSRPGDTPLAASLRDGRTIGPRKPKDDKDDQPANDGSSLMQHSLFSQPLTPDETNNSDQQTNTHNPTAAPNRSSDPPQAHAATQPTTPTQAATNNAYPPTTPGDPGMPQTLQHENMAMAAVPAHADPPVMPQQQRPEIERSWQRVERHLMEIRRLATAFQNQPADTTGIVYNAEQALIHLLVDTPTAQALEPGGTSQHAYDHHDHGGQGSSTAASSGGTAVRNIAADCRNNAHAAALALANIARQQLAEDGRCLSYGVLEPHGSAVMDWMRSLPPDDIAVRVQVPPLITPLRGILEHVLHGRATADDWAALVAVAEALEALCVGTDLVHPADDRATWRMALWQLEQLGDNTESWSTERLPQIQEAAMRLVRGISRRIPESRQGLPCNGGMQTATTDWRTTPVTDNTSWGETQAREYAKNGDQEVRRGRA